MSDSLPAPAEAPAPSPASSWSGWLGEARVAAAVAVSVTAAGLVVGLIWWWVAPTPLVLVGPDGTSVAATSAKAWVADDGWLAVLGAAAGLLAALVSFRWTRRHGIAVVVGLAVGGLLGSVLAWRLGGWLGPAPLAEQTRQAGGRGTFHLPLALRAKGVLFSWPLVSVITCFGLVVGLHPAEPVAAPRPDGPDPWGAPEPTPCTPPAAAPYEPPAAAPYEPPAAAPDGR